MSTGSLLSQSSRSEGGGQHGSAGCHAHRLKAIKEGFPKGQLGVSVGRGIDRTTREKVGVCEDHREEGTQLGPEGKQEFNRPGDMGEGMSEEKTSSDRGTQCSETL